VAAEQGTLTDRKYLENVISSLGNRIFLLHDIHRPRPALFQSRWALTFLRGPMTREQVAELMEPAKQEAENPAPVAAIPLCSFCHKELAESTAEACPHCGKNPWAQARFRVDDHAFREQLLQQAIPTAIPVAPASAPPDPSLNTQPPLLPNEVTQFYLPANVASPGQGAVLEYRPHLLGFAEVIFLIDKRSGREHLKPVKALAEAPTRGHPVDWGRAITVGELAPKPLANACWGPVPDTVDTGKKMKGLEKGFADHLYSTEKLSLWENRALGLVSNPDESQEAFARRCQEAAAREAHHALELERAKFKPKFEALGMDLPDEPRDSGGVLSWIWGSKSSSRKSSGPASTREEEKQRKLEADYEGKKAEIQKKWERAGKELKPIQVKPRKTDIRVTHFGIGWLPVWRTPGKQAREVPGYRP
jgi:hypothetical protein